ncbi:MAG: ABC transporter permease subunit [Kineosporiaceae bacterium]|nr:ABC transporter permease subunit [Kineosporiaceae bacterium]MBK7621273.1 ABC transporter permease subunit [Kineosporiaceae bacterium]
MSAVTAPSGGLRARRRRLLQLWRVVVLVALGSFFVVPLLALFEFSTRGVGEGAPRTMDAWRRIVSDSTLVGAILASLELALLTSVFALVLMVPTMIWVRLRLPQLSRLVEFICLLPLTIPAIVLVVGLGPVYAWVRYLARTDSILTLFLAYVVLVLPYVYRSLDTGLAAIDVRTLSEAARSLGATWFDVIVKVVVPNMAAAVLNSALLCVAIVMGEYTIASLLNYVNLQVAIQQLGLADASMSMAVSLAALIFAFVLLVLLSFVGRRGRRTGRSS